MSFKVKAIVIGGFVALLAIAGILNQAFGGKQVGEACETYQSGDCRGPGAQCLVTKAGKYCTIECKADGDCPKNWKCSGIESETYNSKGKVSAKTVQMCVKP